MKLDAIQIERILDRIVPLIAAPEDHSFFRGILAIKAEETNSGHFAYLVSTLLKEAADGSRRAARAAVSDRVRLGVEADREIPVQRKENGK
jgi:hypothetical protein